MKLKTKRTNLGDQNNYYVEMLELLYTRYYGTRQQSATMVLVGNTHVVSMQMLTADRVDHKLTFAENK